MRGGLHPSTYFKHHAKIEEKNAAGFVTHFLVLVEFASVRILCQRNALFCPDLGFVESIQGHVGFRQVVHEDSRFTSVHSPQSQCTKVQMNCIAVKVGMSITDLLYLPPPFFFYLYLFLEA